MPVILTLMHTRYYKSRSQYLMRILMGRIIRMLTQRSDKDQFRVDADWIDETERVHRKITQMLNRRNVDRRDVHYCSV